MTSETLQELNSPLYCGKALALTPTILAIAEPLK